MTKSERNLRMIGNISKEVVILNYLNNTNATLQIDSSGISVEINGEGKKAKLDDSHGLESVLQFVKNKAEQKGERE